MEYTALRTAMLTSSLSRDGGGVYEIVRSLSNALVEESVDVEVFGLKDKHTEQDRITWDKIEPREYENFGIGAFGYAKGMYKGLLNSCPDIVHQHGLWMYPSLVNYRWKRKTGKVNVITPQGMLEPWSLNHHGWRKAAALHLFERQNLQEADCINANTRAEMEHIRALGLKTPVCIVPNGVYLPTSRVSLPDPPWSDMWPEEMNILLYLGRLHPKKGVKELVQAWARTSSANSHNPWCLAIIGWDENHYGKELNHLITQLDVANRVHWFGPAFGPDKEAALQKAHAFVLPSFSEGLPMAILEAWAHNLPILMTRECNLDVGFSVGAALEIYPDIESIEEGLRHLLSLSKNELNMMGRSGYALVEKQFSWAKVASEMKAVYAWLLGQGMKPDCVFD